MPAARLYLRSRAALGRALTVIATVATVAATGGTLLVAPAASADTPTALSIGPGSQTVDAGTAFPVRVRLVAGDEQLADQLVFLYDRPADGQPWHFFRVVKTDANGYAATPYVASETLQFTARFRGTDGYAPSASGNPTFAVRAGLGSKLLSVAKHYAGAPYQYGAAGPTRFDCSGLTMYVARRLGRALSHNAATQYAQVHHVAKGHQQVGDLVFFTNGSGIYHVGFYAGNGHILAATHTGDVVRLEPIYTSSYLVGRIS